MRLAATLAALTLAAAAQSAETEVGPSTEPVPQGGYEIDKAHTSLTFRVNHLGFSWYTGRFTGIDAKLTFNPAKLEASSVNVTVDPKSIAADHAPEGFLQTLAGEQWLDAGKFPQMTYVSRSIEVLGGNAFRIHGELTLHGVTKPVVLEARYNGGYAGHTYEPRARAGFSARGSLKRSDFGVANGIPAPGSMFGVGDQVEVVLETEFSGPPLRSTTH